MLRQIQASMLASKYLANHVSHASTQAVSIYAKYLILRVSRVTPYISIHTPPRDVYPLISHSGAK